MPATPLILASRSPQRRAILEQLGIAYEAVPVDVDEEQAGEAVAVVRANALRKAEAGMLRRPGRRVLGVDTVVCIDGELLGKPAGEEDARRGLQRLAGRRHEVVSGLVLAEDGNPRVVHEVTAVTFRRLDDDLIDAYLATGEWQGRAGGYAIQGRGAALVARISGDYLNVVGLPAAALLDLDSRLSLNRKSRDT